jgi:naphtho-gamma-pyrone polyketide synthase
MISTSPTHKTGATGQADKGASIIQVILEEAQMNESELNLDAELTDLGVDSLLSLNIASRLRDELGIDLPSSTLMNHSTVREFVVFAGGEVSSDSSSVQSESSARDDDDQFTDTTSIDGDTPDEAAFIERSDKSSRVEVSGRAKASVTKRSDATSASHSDHSFDVSAAPQATSVLLQGSSRNAKKNLFLFPDGAGSATSYYALTDISPDVAVYGLNCPWLKTPQNLKCSLEQYVSKFIVEIRRRQPTGPYHFGGASAGGILAYEAAQQLPQTDRVETMILLDSPDPVGLENPTQRMYDFLDSMGMFGIGSNHAPAWLRPHFDAFLAMLDAYKVKKFVGPSPPIAHMFYARDGMCQDERASGFEMRPDDPREMLWLLNNRLDFSGAGWNSLVGGENLRVSVLDGVNHYTIMQGGLHMEKLCKSIARALRS